MADLVYAKQVVVPAQTQIAAPFTQDISFNPSFVAEIEIVIPDGHAGITGLALAQAHQQVIPADKLTWFVSNDEVLRFAYSDGDGTGNWQAIAYNLDFVNTHTFYIRFFVLLTNPHAGAPQPALLSNFDIEEAGAAAATGAQLGPVGSAGLDTGIPTVTEDTTGFEDIGGADTAASEAELGADVDLTGSVAAGGQGDTADLSGVQFAVAPPDYGPGDA